ncbi:4-hydroxyphenylpyruvate dioxygenase [Chlorella sorokiniana]|jgi:4-hydroxyphenylpyruvate dioxygenase|uniref:4-hydroxyphenylpyruvate dioxygenase n=1 Tax=Chlorella sorokiniana TaxID=3076 RepID=A0A2P6TPN3_CHLSO|nr:4-hydroxyphenylpyruvate dioxygenase [Chlorella sorokiniana]|eukprot:PRW55993.1 4-hydroxyphenylpyruvate dioxygenase [Chlorella sorokiniana]
MVGTEPVAANGGGAPAAAAGEAGHRFKLVGASNFKRSNPRSDLFPMHKFDHLEFWCADATTTSGRFGFGLGMTLVAKSDQSTGNHHFASYVMQTGDLVMAFTAPYSTKTDKSESAPPVQYDQEEAYDFLKKHGLAVRAFGILVDDAAEAYRISTANGGIGVRPPATLKDEATGQTSTYAEVKLYGDCVLRFVSGDYEGPFLPGWQAVEDAPHVSYGLERLDHAVGNVPELIPQVEYMAKALGFHEFAEFTADDVGTVDSGLNSMVMANNNEMILLPVNEPTFGTKRKSQIQTYLEQNEGPGLQHVALKTDDIFGTMRKMRAVSRLGGFDFMPAPSDTYYRDLPKKMGSLLTPQQYKEVEELGLLVDKDDQGVLLQIFTKPLGDRPTVFFEIIERLCTLPPPAEVPLGDGEELPRSRRKRVPTEVGGCGGFGKGNFGELFKSLEAFETDLGIN